MISYTDVWHIDKFQVSIIKINLYNYYTNRSGFTFIYLYSIIMILSANSCEFRIRGEWNNTIIFNTKKVGVIYIFIRLKSIPEISMALLITYRLRDLHVWNLSRLRKISISYSTAISDPMAQYRFSPNLFSLIIINFLMGPY